MKSIRSLALIVLLGCLPILGGCSSDKSSGNSVANALDDSISSALDQAQEKLRSEPIDVSHNDRNLPKAEITPKGDFIVAGKNVAITPAQRAALLEYREKLIEVASQGIEVGKQGAALGIHAASAAIAGAFSGKSGEEIERSVKAQAADIRQAALKLCKRLPAMMAEQQQLAAALPAFKPYATMTQDDIDDCMHDATTDDDSDRAQVQQKIREQVRTGIRSGIRNAAQGAGLASSGTTDSGTAATAASTNQY